jgi:hypothetical protein
MLAASSSCLVTSNIISDFDDTDVDADGITDAGTGNILTLGGAALNVAISLGA